MSFVCFSDGVTLPQDIYSSVCPHFEPGRQTSYFQTTFETRPVEVWFSSPKQPGPLYAFWHGNDEQPSQILDILGGALNQILNTGGVVVAPYKSEQSDGNNIWSFSQTTDLDLLDKVFFHFSFFHFFHFLELKLKLFIYCNNLDCIMHVRNW